MTEHVCEWEYAWVDSPAHHVFCCRCGEFLDDDDVEARLNEYETLKAATERLSAEDARRLGDIVEDDGMDGEPLFAYANILEGKDE